MANEISDAAPDPGGRIEPRCLACDAGLDWHQPDAQQPDRLLGVCQHCGGWHLLQIRPRAKAATFVLLFDGREPRPVDPQADRAASRPALGTGRGGPPPDDPIAVARPGGLAT